MPMMTWELWLAREIVVDNPLPWQNIGEMFSAVQAIKVANAEESVLARLRCYCDRRQELTIRDRFFAPSRTAYTPQEQQLFSNTLRENILLGLDASHQEL